MASLPIEFSPSALRDSQETRDYHAAQNVTATGQRVVRELVEAIRSLSDYPQMGRIVLEFDMSSLRELIRPPFRIVYRLEPERIAIIRILRSERLLHLPDEG